MRWKPLARFRDASVPKLHNLRRGAQAGLTVPPTVWLRADQVDPEDVLPPEGHSAPWVVRSASPAEDTSEGTAAGRFVSRVVTESDPAELRTAVRAVVDSLRTGPGGRAEGAVFLQPLLVPERGGVVFFDGFSYECTTAPGGNIELTSGRKRGEVQRGELQRGDAFSIWLTRLGRVFTPELAGGAALDVEFAREGDQFVLLQARPARFGLRRDPVLSLANHREILGDPPSPWVVSALERAGSEALSFFAEVDPEVGRWGERYAVALGGRAWLNFSFFFRLMDHWGLPRTFVTEGVGGQGGGPLDGRVNLARMLRKGPRLLRLQLANLRTVLQARRDLDAFGREVECAGNLRALHGATAFGLAVALRTNFAINGALTGLVRVRRFLGLRGRARVTTEAMMEDYDTLREVPSEELEPRLDAWLEAYGHRGPLESDPARPRFSELREVLLVDLRRPARTVTKPRSSEPSWGRGLFFTIDRKREWFRDELMRIWQDLRRRILEAAESEGLGPEDVFLLTEEDFSGPAQPDFEERRTEQARLATVDLPGTAQRSRIEACLTQEDAAPRTSSEERFPGVSLSDAVFEGRVRRASDLVGLLEAEARAGQALLDEGTVLVVPALEPSWAVVFGRVGAVVTELGGELSHASILLREARKPAIVNCVGVFEALADGDHVRLDGPRGMVELLRHPAEEE